MMRVSLLGHVAYNFLSNLCKVSKTIRKKKEEEKKEGMGICQFHRIIIKLIWQ